MKAADLGQTYWHQIQLCHLCDEQQVTYALILSFPIWTVEILIVIYLVVLKLL